MVGKPFVDGGHLVSRRLRLVRGSILTGSLSAHFSI